MLRIMLCGASDTGRIRDDFAEVVTQFGGDPWHYLSGRILHLNSAQASWEHNSRLTVQNADLCIFVIVERYGQLTWEAELHEAVISGKPFLVFCLDETYQTYLALTRAITDQSAIVDGDERQLIATIRELESERQLTLVPFRYGSFREELRRQLGTLFALSLAQLEERNRRSAVARLLSDPAKLTVSDLAIAARIALDETEDKGARKRSIKALAARGSADEESVLGLLSSEEQGVTRLTVQNLESLYVTRPPDPDFFDHCVSIANESDDIGLARRLIPSLLGIDVAVAVRSLALLDLTEIGSRRRLAQELEAVEETIIRQSLTAEVISMLERCLEETRESGWKARCLALKQRLAS